MGPPHTVIGSPLICNPFQALMGEGGEGTRIFGSIPTPIKGILKSPKNKITLLPPQAEESDKSREFRIREASLKNRARGCIESGTYSLTYYNIL